MDQHVGVYGPRLSIPARKVAGSAALRPRDPRFGTRLSYGACQKYWVPRAQQVPKNRPKGPCTGCFRVYGKVGFPIEGAWGCTITKATFFRARLTPVAGMKARRAHPNITKILFVAKLFTKIPLFITL